MADPGMMSLFGEDGNLFSEGLEGLGECGYPENPVNSMAQQMPMDQGFGAMQSPLHHSTSNQNQSKLTHFDHYNQYEPQKMHMIDQPNRMMANTPGNGIASPHSQYHNTAVPQVPHGGNQMGVYPGMQNGPSFVDNGAMWGPRAVQVPEQIRPPYQQQSQQQPPAPSGPQGQPHPQHVQQMGNYMVRGDFSMQQHGPLPSQRMNQFSQGQDGLNQGNPFLGAAGPGHLSHVPQQNPNMGASLRHTVQQFHHHPPTTLHGESVAHSPGFSPNPSQQGAVRPQSLNFNSRNQTVPSPTLNNSGQYSRYPYSNLNQGLVNNTGMNQNLGLTNNTPMTPSVPRYPNAVGFPSNNSQGLMHQQTIHPSGSLNQMNTQTMHPSQPQGTYASPPPMSPLKAMSNPAGTPPPQVRPGSAGIPMDVGSYPNMPHPPPTHQPPGSIGMGQRNIGPRNIQQSQAFMGMSSAPREMGGHMRPNGCPGVSHADPQAIQERMMSGQQHPAHQSFQQQMANCQPHPAMHHQSSPPSHSHHQPWTSLHQSPQNTPQKVPVHQHSPSESFLDNSMPDMTLISGPNASLINTEDFLPSMQSQTPQKKRKKKNNHIATDKTVEGFGLEGFPGENPDLLIDGAPDGKKKKKPKVKKEPKEPKEPKAKKEPKEPKAPKQPKPPKEPKEKKAKTTTPKPKASKKTSNKSDAEGSAQKKKVSKVKPEGIEPLDLDKTPPPSPPPPPPPEEEDDSGVQKRRSSRQVKRKRYTEDLEMDPTGKSGEGSTELGHLYWPNTSALTTRLRRLITAYQRSYKRQQMRQDSQMKIDRRRRRPRDEVRALEAEREAIITEKRQKWTRREEADFYRVVSTFGVIFDHAKQKFDWNQFRAYARLDKKSDESLEKYFSCFVAMCRRVCRMGTKPDEDMCDLSMMIEPITEERASRTLYRIELLRKIREQVLNHPQLNERLKLCQSSIDLPEWWDCGKHDRDLLVGAAKHGVSRTDYHILNDPDLSFLEAHRSFAQNKGSSQPSNLPILIPPGPGYSDTPPIMPSTPNPDEKGSGNEEVKTETVEDPAIKEEAEVKEEQAADTAEKPVKQESDPEAIAINDEIKIAEEAPKSISEKGSEEDDEKLDYDDKSEESSQAEVGITSQDKNFDEESNASLSTARDETRDGFFLEDGEQSGLHMLRERTFSFSFWPKDRVMINRLDNICETVLKGKWPVNRRQMFDFPGLLPGYTPTAVDSPLQKRSFAELSMVAQGSYSGSEDISASPQVSQETALSLSVPRQRRRRRRKIEVEAERAAKRRNLMEMVAQLRGSQMGAENGQEKVVDLSNASREATSSTSSFPSLTSQFLLNNSSTPVSDAFKTQMERLQAGLSCTPTRHLLNGSLIDGEPPMKRRRGRRKNVEGLDLLFMSNKRSSLSVDDTDVTKAYDEDIETPPTRNIPSPGQLEPETRIPVINLDDGTRLVGEEAPKNKDLVEWLKLHPTYTVDMPSYVPKTADMLFSHFQKPKQKRHRCRNPNKLDINTLTGDERVPVVNKRNGKKMGGAMAPPMRDLPRWLEENPEFGVSPDWTDIVKQSGFVPESMFDRLLTGPVVREEGASRRGRRPKSEIAKAAAAAVASTSGMNPLLMNSLFAGMDLASLQNLQNLQSLQLAGLMGFPPGLAAAAAAGGDSKNPAAMLPLMLPGMAGLPNLFGLDGLLNNPLAAGNSNSTTASSQGETEDGTSKADEKKTETEEDAKDSDKTDTVSATDSGSVGAAATTTAGLSANPLAFSPFLLSTMAPGLFYPSMFLPPGLGGLTLPGFPSLAGLQSAVSSSEEKAADDGENQEASDAEESIDKTADSSILDDEMAQGEEGESPDGEDELDNETEN
ncbi:chromodomain helicase DNA binding protein 7 L homeolog [Xenopus laevis]|uniref:Chromodomain helicase DNA binding protein 7 L homeolog n=1 Tax=Xenopus laevis TaxID=8355 RepID=A1A5K3_XENLA|nr:chromodomain helicase DNA binding protein 7 L homeolog [Xenopus laevis]AAI28692.1 LOC443577 protein [Xenopus laevis]